MSGKSATHSAGKGSIRHNNREIITKNVDKERISENITYVKQPLREAYEDLFGEAVQNFNARQKNKDRRINDYYEHLFGRAPTHEIAKGANKQKSFYEVVVGIGDMDDTHCGTPDGIAAATALDEYMRGWKERNPNFYVFNAVLHLDEHTPHIHIDYIPIAHKTRGMAVQNGMAGALSEMGYTPTVDSKTKEVTEQAITKWHASERSALREIAARHGIKIREAEQGRGETFTVKDYKIIKDEEKQRLAVEVNELTAKKDEGEKHVKGLRNEYKSVKSEVKAETDKLTAIKAEVKTAEDNLVAVKSEIKAETDKLTAIRAEVNTTSNSLKNWQIQIGMADEQLTKVKDKVFEVTRELNTETAKLNEVKDKVFEVTQELDMENAKLNRVKDEVAAVADERSAVELEIKPYRNISREIKEIDLTDVTNIPMSGRVAIKKEKLEELKEQAKTYIANQDYIAARPLVEQSFKLKKAELEKKEKDLNKREAVLEKNTEGVAKNNQALLKKYEEQKDLNRLYGEVKDENTSLRTQIENLGAENNTLKETLTSVQETLKGAYNAIKSIVQAVGMLIWDKSSGYAVQNLSPKQSNLIKAIGNAAVRWAKEDGFPEHAAEMEKNVKISKGIQSEIDKLSPRSRSYEMSR